MKELNIKKYLEEFITGNNIKCRKEYSVIGSLNNDKEEERYIYNEMSFQHELGEYLRERLDGKKYLIQFERNIKAFGYESKEYPKKYFRKKEIDIVIINKKTKEKYAIELKYHYKKYGEIPDVMYNCIKDMDFMYKCLELGFTKTYCVMVAEDKGFYTGESKEGDIYTFFRTKKSYTEIPDYAYIQRNDKIAREKSKINIKEIKKDRLPIKWEPIADKIEARYYILEF